MGSLTIQAGARAAREKALKKCHYFFSDTDDPSKLCEECSRPVREHKIVPCGSWMQHYPGDLPEARPEARWVTWFWRLTIPIWAPLWLLLWLPFAKLLCWIARFDGNPRDWANPEKSHRSGK